MKAKNPKPWIILIVAPFVLLIATSILQLIVRFVSGGDSSIVATIVNILSLLAGIVAVVGIMGLPIWIVMLIITLSHNSKLQHPVAPTPPVETDLPAPVEQPKDQQQL